MASQNSKVNNIPFPVICSAFQLPRGPPEFLDIKKAIGPLNTEADQKLNALESTRDTLEKLMGGSVPGGKWNCCLLPQCELSTLAPSSEILACINSYYPLLAELIVSLVPDPESLAIVDRMRFEWPSPLTRIAVKVQITRIATGRHLLGALYLESCMLLVTRAYMLAEEARVTVGTMCSSTSEFKKGADMLCRAAGILDFVAFKIENDWSKDLSSLLSIEQRPLETTPVLCKGLRDIYIAQAQGMAVAQAIANGSAKASVLCKLAQGVTQHMSSGVACLESIPNYHTTVTGVAAKNVGDKHSSITQYWKFYSSVWSTLAYRFAAEIEWEKDAYGKAVAYQERAVEWSASASEPFFGELALINSSIRAWRDSEAATLSRYKDENSTIYYDPVPPSDRLDSLPAAVTIMKPIPFTEPEAVPFSLSLSADTPLPTPPPPMAPPPAYTDAVAASVGTSAVGTSSEALSAAQRRLEGMGFESNAVKQALTKHNQNEQAAIEQLLSNT